jgi:hypothetical protein
MKVDIARLSSGTGREPSGPASRSRPFCCIRWRCSDVGGAVPDFDFAAGHSLGEYGALAVTGRPV